MSSFSIPLIVAIARRIAFKVPRRSDRMIGNGDSMLPGLVRFENDVDTFLIHPPIAEMFTEKLDQFRPAQITR